MSGTARIYLSVKPFKGCLSHQILSELEKHWKSGQFEDRRRRYKVSRAAEAKHTVQELLSIQGLKKVNFMLFPNIPAHELPNNS